MKIIVIGASTTGKTETYKYLKVNNFSTTEIDEELKKLNGELFPEELVKQKLASRIVEDILGKEEIIFFANAQYDYFSIEKLKEAREKGFQIFQLILERPEMEKRNKDRMKKENYDDLSIHFDDMVEYQEKVFELGLVDRVINVKNKTERQIAGEIIYLANLHSSK